MHQKFLVAAPDKTNYLLLSLLLPRIIHTNKLLLLFHCLNLFSKHILNINFSIWEY
nr:MAG TPA: hypothetical protein [Caudoviricetes sp.]